MLIAWYPRHIFFTRIAHPSKDRARYIDRLDRMKECQISNTIEMFLERSTRYSHTIPQKQPDTNTRLSQVSRTRNGKCFYITQSQRQERCLSISLQIS